MAQVNNIDEISQDITEIILNSPLFLTLIEMVLVYFDHWILLVLLMIFNIQIVMFGCGESVTNLYNCSLVLP